MNTFEKVAASFVLVVWFSMSAYTCARSRDAAVAASPPAPETRMVVLVDSYGMIQDVIVPSGDNWRAKIRTTTRPPAEILYHLGEAGEEWESVIYDY